VLAQHVKLLSSNDKMQLRALAEKHCNQFQRIAKFNHMEERRAIYDCVSRSH